jgi:F-type H+-transporting ATPase subunit epsilon
VATTVPFKLISPAKILFEGEAELVIAVTTEGEEGILPSHAPFLAALRPGVLRANVRHGGMTQRLEFATSSGFMQALPGGVTILIDAAVTHADVDRTKTEEELSAAQTQLASLAPYTPDYDRTKAALNFAQAKLALRSIP